MVHLSHRSAVSSRRTARRAAARGKPNLLAARLALALLALAGSLGLIAAEASDRRAAAATPVTVRITIQRVIGLFCFDDDEVFGGCGSAPDFYPNVSINGGPFASKGAIDDTSDISPTDWQFSASVDRDTTTSVPMRIEIRDEDGGLRGDDDVADINPLSGTADLIMTLQLGQVPCTFTYGGLTGTCGLPVDVTGAGSDGEALARIIFRVDVLNDLPDADGDGIPNTWEQSGVTLNGQFIDLPAMGADPNRPDIFIHLDWMQDATRNQALTNAALQQVVNAFANSPYISPTGSVGINMHIDQGGGSTLNFATGTTWGGLSRAGAIPVQNNLGFLTGGDYNWSQFEAIKSARFEPTGRSPIFHYVIAGVFQEAPAAGAAQNTSSGISRNDGNAFTSGSSDFLITLGGFTGGAGTTQQQAGTLMHELGHNLGLQHGGNESANNYKPNYLSIMNYLFQMRGLDVGANAGVLDYSRSVLPPLNENALNEANALGLVGFGTGSRCPVASPAGTFRSQFTANANAPFDWNCNAFPSPNGVVGSANDGVVSFDANGGGTISASLTGFNDWPAIVFKGGQIGQLGAGNLPLLSPVEPEIPWDLVPPTTTAQVVPAPNGYGWNRAAVLVTLRATDNPDGFGVRDLTYSATGAQPIGSATVSGDTVSFPISAEGITTITFAARDQALNVETAKTLVVRVDLTDPTIALGTAYPAPNAAGWNNTDVNVPFTAADVPSGIANTVPPTSPLVLTAEGVAVTGTITATDRADRSTSVTTPAFKIDKTPPVITVTAPTPNQVFDSDQTMTSIFAATDSLSGMKSIAAVLDTGQVVTSGETIPLGLLVGRRTLTVTATDVADNVATLVVPFRVRPVFVGVAYNDGNESAVREGDEMGIANLLVFLDVNGNGRPDAGEPSNATNGAGAFRVVGEDVGPARLCTMPVSADRVRTTSRCQTLVVATGIPVPKVDFGSHARVPGCTTGGVAAVIQSIALAGRPDEYWRPTALAGGATGPYAGSRLVVRNGGANPAVQVGIGERVATGLFVGGVDAGRIGNLALDVQYQRSHQSIVAIVAADGSVAVPAAAPTTAFAYETQGNKLTIYGVPQDGLGGYQDVWLITEITSGNGNVTITAGIAGTVATDQGQPKLRALGNTCNDNAKADITGGLGGPLPGVLLVDDVPDAATRRNPY